MARTPARQTRGFTLIELVVVIVILGVLAAVAVPRFVDICRQARVAGVKTMAAVVQATVDNVHTACVLRINGCDPDQGLIAVYFDGQPLAIVYGYPRGGYSDGIASRVDSTGFVVTELYSYETGWVSESAPNPPACGAFYRDAFNGGPAVRFDISDC